LNQHDDSSATIEWVCALLCDWKKILTRQSARLWALVLGLQFLDLILALRKEVGNDLGQGPSGRKALKLIPKEALRNRERYLPKVEDTSQKNKTPSNKTEGIDVDWTSDSALGGALQLH